MTKKKTVVPVVAQPPPYQPQTPITQQALRELYRHALEQWQEQADHYNYQDPAPDHVVKKQQAILAAVDVEQAHVAVKRAADSALTTILSSWAKGKITGPDSPAALERRAKKAESLAKMLEAKGLDDQARSQWARAEELWAKVKAAQIDIGATKT